MAHETPGSAGLLVPDLAFIDYYYVEALLGEVVSGGTTGYPGPDYHGVGSSGVHGDSPEPCKLIPRLGPGAKGLGNEGAVAELEELAEAAAALGIVQGLVEVSAAGEVGQGLHLVVE